jgi:hypothetical protein
MISFFVTKITHLKKVYPQKLALTSPTGGGRSVGIVRSRTKAMEFIEWRGTGFQILWNFASDMTQSKAIKRLKLGPVDSVEGNYRIPF